MSYAYYMGRDVEALLGCDGIILCQDWFDSKGCRLECNYPRTEIRNGRRYEGYEGRCKMCKVETLHKRVIEVKQEKLNFKE